MTRRATDRLSRLSALAALIADREVAEVAAASAVCTEIEHRIAEIARHRGQLAGSAEDPVHAALMGHQSQRLRTVQTEAAERLARAKVDLEMAKAKARPAIGRKAVLEKLLAEARRADQRS